MRCGICKKDEMPIYGAGDQVGQVLAMGPIRNAQDLNKHKNRDHRDELRALQTKRHNADKAKRDQEMARHARQREAIEAMGVMVLMDSHYGDLVVASTHKLDVRDITPGVRDDWGRAARKEARYPEPEGYETWLTVKAEADALMEEAEAIRLRSWEAGTPVTQADLLAIKQAGERAYYAEGV